MLYYFCLILRSLFICFHLKLIQFMNDQIIFIFITSIYRLVFKNINARILSNITFHKYLQMGDQFNFQEISAIDWLKDASQWTDKHPLTLSDVSKQQFLDYLLDQEPENKGINHHKIIAHQKEKKNLHAKNYRDKKRGQFETMKKQIEMLQHENNVLKSQKYCRFCKKSFAPNVVYTSTFSGRHEQNCKAKTSSYDKPIQMQFEQPQFFTKKRDVKTGKIWIAIGVLMLVLGLTMWGFEGDKSYISKIELQRQQISKWLQQVTQREKDEYMQVNYRIMQQNNPNSKSEVPDLQLRFRSPSESDRDIQEEQVSINKDILFSIHAELEDIGLYI